MTILKQKLEKDGDETRLITTYDTGEAQRIARMVSEQGRPADENHRLLGFIPPEMWGYDPWLMQAQKARRGGDMGEYTRMIQKFFEVHPQFACHFQKKYY